MKRIKTRLRLFEGALAASTLSLILCGLRCGSQGWEASSLLLLLLFLTASLLCLGACIRQFNIYRSAKLILDNRLLCIPSAKSPRQDQCLDVYISGFGVLLGDRVIPMNTGRIRMLDLRFQGEYLTITYGRGERKESLTLLSGTIPQAAFKEFSRQFFHETGIVV